MMVPGWNVRQELANHTMPAWTLFSRLFPSADRIEDWEARAPGVIYLTRKERAIETERVAYEIVVCSTEQIPSCPAALPRCRAGKAGSSSSPIRHHHCCSHLAAVVKSFHNVWACTCCILWHLQGWCLKYSWFRACLWHCFLQQTVPNCRRDSVACGCSRHPIGGRCLTLVSMLPSEQQCWDVLAGEFARACLNALHSQLADCYL